MGSGRCVDLMVRDGQSRRLEVDGEEVGEGNGRGEEERDGTKQDIEPARELNLR